MALPATITLESPVMREGAEIPKEFTVDGANISPPLSWHRVPPAAKELVLVFEDLDFVSGITGGRPLVHWIVYDMKPTVTGLKAAILAQPIVDAAGDPDGIFQAHTTFDMSGYRGPQPPPGPPHRYRFTLFALNRALGLQPDMGALSFMQALDAAKNSVVGQGSLTVTYQRKL
jgi:Raf kinase inhibitor-like YbhB/YbcL family protein